MSPRPCRLAVFLLATMLCAQTSEPFQRWDKTELAAPFSVVSATGAEFGLPTLWWWHRISAGWGLVRREVAELYVSDPAKHELFTLQGGQQSWMPDHLSQQMEMDDLVISEDRFVDGAGIGAILRFRNTAKTARTLRLYFAGKTEGRCRIGFDKPHNRLQLAETKDYGARYPAGSFLVYQELAASQPIAGWGIGAAAGDLQKFMDGPLGFGVFVDDSNVRKYVTEYEGSGYFYAIQVELPLPADGTQTLRLSSAFATDSAKARLDTDRLLQTGPSLLKAIDDRVRTQLSTEWPRLQTPDEKVNRLWYYLWYVLDANRASRGAAVKADFNVPTKFGYWGCYVWDTAFHAIGQAFLADKRTAEESVRALLSLQYPNGFLPINAGADDAEVITPGGTYYIPTQDFYDYQEQADPYRSKLIYQHPSPHQWGVREPRGELEVLEKTQLPIIGLAVAELNRISGDRTFLAEIYPQLARYDDWMWRRRNTGDGLLVWYNGDESGWDNAARLLPLPVKTVDGSVAAHLLHESLARFASELGREQDAKLYGDRAALCARSINGKMWSDGDSFYHDLSLQDIPRPQKSPAGFLPFLAGLVPADRAAALVAHLKNPQEFWTPYPLPTVSKDDPQFNTNTWGWNGPTWIPSNWLVMEGLARAGHVDTANELLARTIEMMSKPNGFPTATEQYNSETGEPFGVADYSWSGVINHYLVKWVAGIQPDAAADTLTIAPRLLPGWRWLDLQNVHIGNHAVGLRLDRGSTAEKLTFTHSGAAALKCDITLPIARAPRSVRLNGTMLRASEYEAAGGLLRLKRTLGNGTTVLEALYP